MQNGYRHWHMLLKLTYHPMQKTKMLVPVSILRLSSIHFACPETKNDPALEVLLQPPLMSSIIHFFHFQIDSLMLHKERCEQMVLTWAKYAPLPEVKGICIQAVGDQL